MVDEIIAYLEMCRREGVSLQKGMNYRLAASHSVLLMSQRPNAPYRDQIVDAGTTLIYEGHDVPRSETFPDPKAVDQPEFTASGSLTENGKFHRAAQEYKDGGRPPERVRVYEKIRQGIWSYNGLFHLVDSWREEDDHRSVFKFKLKAVEESVESDSIQSVESTPSRRRVIPTEVKLEVWRRDNGQCVKCGATDELHFDHIIPFSRGGTSVMVENVQLLCARHNLEKSDSIQ